MATPEELARRQQPGVYDVTPAISDYTRGLQPTVGPTVRFGVTPLYTRHVDVWDAVEHLRQVLASGEWREPRFNQRGVVT